MKKFTLVILGIIFAGSSFGQLTGPKTIPGDYASITAAVAALNVQGVGTGGVTFNVAANYSETLTGRLDLTATGTSSNQITFIKQGTGANPALIAYTGISSAGTDTPDGMFALVGSDWVTINGIDLQENPANLDAATTMEYGYGLFKSGPTDGANNNTIKNCTITLNRVNNTAGGGPYFQGSVGIHLLDCTPTSGLTTMVITAASGASSNNSFYSNTIQNCNCCISLSGYAAASPYTLGDWNNDIGGSSTATGNNLINFGGGTGATQPANGVFLKNQWNFNISYNIVNNNNGSGVNHPVLIRGIFPNLSSNGASGIINNNTITMQGGGTTTQVSCIESSAGASGSGNTITINNNLITNCSNATNTTGTWYGIYVNGATSTNLNIQNNSFVNNSNIATTTAGYTYLIYNNSAIPGNINITGNNLSQNFPGTAAGYVYGIYNSGGTTTTTLNISNNNFSNFNYTTTGSYYLYFIYNGASCANTNFNNNTWTNLSLNHNYYQYLIYNGSSTQNALNVNNNSIVGSFTRTAAASYMYCYYAGSSSLPVSTQTISGNNFSNITATTAGTGTLYLFYNSDGATSPYPRKSIFNNTFSNINYNTTGATYGIYCSYLGDASGSPGSSIYNNTLSNITVGGTFYGIYPTATVSANNVVNVYGNTVADLSSSGAASPVYGAYLGGGGAGLNFYNNKISGITANGATGTAYGVYVLSATTTNIYNNFVSDIKSPAASPTFPAPSAAGLYVSAGTTVNAFYNSIFMNATGSGTNFGSAGVYASTTPTFTLQNNIIVNTSVPNGTGKTIAYQRSAATPGTYGSASNNNCLYAGTPGASNLIYYDPSYAYQSINDFKTLFSPRDVNSVSENPPFLNALSAPFNLHLNTTIGTQCESGGSPVTTPVNITTDIDGDTRSATIPDIGADEFNGIYQDLTPPIITVVPLQNTSLLTARTITVTVFDISGVPTSGAGLPMLYWRINSGIWAGVQGTSLGGNQYSFIFGAGVGLSDVVNYYIVAQDIISPAPNIISSPASGAGGFTFNPPAASVIPATFYSYAIVAPLSGSVTVGTGGTYPTLTGTGGLFSTINASVLTGNLTATIISNITEDGSNALQQWSEQGAGGYTLSIVPSDGTNKVISGAVANAMIRFDGADRVTIDGRFGGAGRNLRFVNTDAANPVFLFINDASNNTLTYLDIRSANVVAAANTVVTAIGTIPGAIAIGTTTGPNGNDNNTISYCRIHSNAGVNLGVGIYAGNGTAAGLASNNDYNTISNNNIFDFFLAASASAAIDIAQGNNNWSIISNNIFETANLTITGTQTIRGLWVTPNTGSLTSASGFIITGNYIGGTAVQCGGTPLTATGTTAYTWMGMDISVGIGIATSVQGNTINNINITSANSSLTAVVGIGIANGNTNVGTVTANIIGDPTVNTSPYGITYTTTVTLGGFVGIRVGAGGAHNVSNNIISGIELIGNATTVAPSFNGINYAGGTSCIINNNTIGSPTLANSIIGSSTSATSTSASAFRGIVANTGTTINSTITNNTIANVTSNYSGTGSGNQVIGIAVVYGTTLISGNTIRNLTTYTQGTGGGATCAIQGIAYSGSTAPVVITGNTIHTLKDLNTTTTAALQCCGIYFQGATGATNQISRNLIHSISIASPTNSASYITGMDLGTSGQVVTSNNIIRLGMDENGADIVSPCTVRGITKNVCSASLYFNTIYIGGSNVGSTATNTFAFVTSSASTDAAKNNIFVNNRSNSSTGGKHYAINLISLTGMTINYNDYYATGNGGMMGAVASVDDASLAAWQVAVVQDVNSLNNDPSFTNALVTPPNFIPNTGNFLLGTSISGITTDYLGNTRYSPPAMGAYEGILTFSVTGSGSYCLGGTGATVSLSNSQTGVNYQLYKGASTVGTPVAGTGSILNFTNITAGTGTYSVTATSAYGGPLGMNGNAAIVENPPATQPVSGGNQTGTYGGSIPNLTVTASGTANWYSDAGLTILVYSGLSFATGQTAIGTYTYYVTNTVSAGCVSAPITITLTIQNSGVPQPVSGGNLSACFGGTIPNLSVTATGIAKWYSNPGLTTLVYTGLSYATGQTAVGTYTYYVTNTVASLESAPITITLTINALPAAPTSGGNLNGCVGGTIPLLTATGSGTIKWYSDVALTTLIYTGTSYSTGQTAAGIYTYYVTNTSAGSCVSPATTISLNIHALPAVAVSGGNQTACFGGTIPSLSVTAGGTAKWYSDVALTTLVYTGATYATGQTAAGTYTYYVTNNDGFGCASASIVVTLTIQAAPAAPVSGGNQSGCFGGTIPSLSVTATGTAKWYSDVALTTLVNTGLTYSTGQIAVGVYNYYVTNTNGSGCVSSPTTVTLTISAAPAAPVSGGNQSVCVGGTIPSLSVTASGTAKWYSDVALTTLVYTGTTFASGQTAAGIYNYYVTNTLTGGCVSAATTVTLTINALPAAPVSGGNQATCFGSTVPSLSVTASGTIKWYGDAGLTTIVNLGSTYTTGLTAVGVYTFYVTNTNANNCVSAATTVTLTIRALPAAPVSGGDQSVVFGGTIPNLTVTATGTAKWYGTPALTTLLYTGLSYATGQTAVGVYTYYVTNTDGNGCVSPATTVTLNILTPSIPPISNGNQIACFGGSIPNLSVTATGTAKWYATPALTTLLYTGLSYATGQTAVGVYTYYVTNTDGGGYVSAPITVTLTILALPASPVSGGNQSGCVGGYIPGLSVTGSGTIKWYSDAGLTTLVNTGSNYTTGQTAVGVYNYYVTSTNANGCASLPTTVTLTIHSLPSAPVSGGNQSACFGTSVPALSVTASGTAVWYSDVNLLLQVHIGSSFNTGLTAAGTYTYYVTNSDVYGCSSTAIPVSLTIRTLPVSPVSGGNQVAVFNGTIPNLTVTAPGTAKWYSNAGLTNLVYTGSSYATGMTAVGIYTYYVTNTDAFGCVSPPITVTLNIQSSSVPPVSGGNQSVCYGSTVPALFVTATGTVKWYSDISLTTLVNTSLIYYPAVSAVGVYTYYVTNTDSYGFVSTPTIMTLTIHALPVVSWGTTLTSQCINSTSYTLSGGSPTLGTYSGSGVSAGIFNASVAGSGVKTLTYTYSDIYGCSSQATNTITVNVLPVPVVTGPASACVGSTSNVYTTQAGMTNYQWSVASGGTVTAGGTATSNSVTVTWNTAGDYAVNVNYTNSNGCTALAAVTYPVIVNPVTYASVTGPMAPCLSGTGNVYTTQPGMTNYNWVIPTGANITAGGTSTSNSVTIQWTSVGLHTISVSYTSPNPCTSPAAAVIGVNVSPLPAPTIIGSVTVCEGAEYTYTTQTGMSNYTWNVPLGGTISNGGGSGNNSVTVLWAAGNYTVTLNYTNSYGCVALAATQLAVHANPQPVPTLSGPAQQCLNSSTTFTTEPGMSNYIWSIPAGASVVLGGGAANNSVTVVWNTSGPKVISVTYTLPTTGCPAAMPTEKTVNIIPIPSVSVGGNVSIYLGNSVQLNAVVSGGAPPYTYNWLPANNLSNSLIANPVATPPVTRRYTVLVTDNIGCGNSDSLLVTVLPATTTITGVVTYNNVSSTPMNNTRVYLKNILGVAIDSATTTASGAYTFINPPAGTYTITGKTSKAWGGVNSTDAQLAMSYFAQYITLTPVARLAADVTGEGAVNSIDALMIAKRFTYQLSSFTVSDWLFNVAAFTVTNSPVVHNFKAVCAGDVNGSYLPPSTKVNPTVELSTSGSIPVKSFESLSLPVTLQGTQTITAISLVLKYPESMMRIKGVEMEDASQVLYSAVDGELRISWYSLTPLRVSDDKLLTINVETKNFRATGNADLSFELVSESELAGNDATVINQARISCPKLAIMDNQVSINNYPNPFDKSTNIEYNLTEGATVSLSIFNAYGELIALPVDKVYQMAGNYNVIFNEINLVPGIYYCRFEVSGTSKSAVLTRRMVVAR